MSCKRIGLTGGIGSGKSTVARIFADLGAFVIDADEISRGALRADSGLLGAVREAFGPDVFHADGSLNRAALAGVVFSDDVARRRLNAIVHPYVLSEMERRAREAVEKQSPPALVFDVPLLFESGFERTVDHVVVVAANDALRMRRVAERDGCTEAEVQRRMRMQLAQSEQIARADETIWNEGSADELRQRCRLVFDRLVGRADSGGMQ